MGGKRRLKRPVRRATPPATAELKREQVLEALNQLHIDFAALERLSEAGPLLHKLMEIAYYAVSSTRRLSAKSKIEQFAKPN